MFIETDPYFGFRQYHDTVVTTPVLTYYIHNIHNIRARIRIVTNFFRVFFTVSCDVFIASDGYGDVRCHLARPDVRTATVTAATGELHVVVVVVARGGMAARAREFLSTGPRRRAVWVYVRSRAHRYDYYYYYYYYYDDDDDHDDDCYTSVRLPWPYIRSTTRAHGRRAVPPPKTKKIDYAPSPSTLYYYNTTSYAADKRTFHAGRRENIRFRRSSRSRK